MNLKWSHSTFIKPEYRSQIGLDFFLRIYDEERVFGYGLTDINKALHKMVGSTFYNPSKAYLLQIETSPIYSKEIGDNFPETISVCNVLLKKARDASDIRYPNHGYWNESSLAIDFVRDENFIRNRFFESNNNYYLYYLESSSNTYDPFYFVVRVRNCKGKRCLYMVDYRFDLDNPMSFQLILDAIILLAKINHIEVSYIFSTLPHKYIDPYERLFLWGEDSVIISNIKTNDKCGDIFVTPADSDSDLLPIL